MKKSKLFLLGAILASFSFSAAALDEAFNPGRFPTYDTKQHNSNANNNNYRKLTSFTLTNTAGNVEDLNEPEFNVDQSTEVGSTIYYNLLDSASFAPFQTRAGNTVTLTPNWNDGWMHGFLFIDYNQDLPLGGGFNSILNNTNKSFNNTTFTNALKPSPDGELVAFSAYQISSTYYDSNAVRTTDGVGINMPTFTIPADLQPGIYDALYKIDWSNISQHGASDIGTNGGVAVRFRIKVVGENEHSVSVSVAETDTEKGSVYLEVDGVRHNSNTIENTYDAVVCVATPAENHYFANWTDAETGEVVSTDFRYSVTDAGTFNLVAHFLNQEEFDNLPDEAFDPNKITSKYNRIVNGKTAEDRFLDRFRLTNGTGSSLNEPIFNVDQPKAPNSSLYVNLTEGDNTPIFQTQPGNTVRFDSIAGSMSWLHGYLFIDYRQDGGFNSKLNTTGFTLNNDAMKNSDLITVDDKKGELVSFSCFNLNTTGVSSNDNFVDSRGNSIPKEGQNIITYGSGVTPSTMPEFTIPEDLEPGIYDALFKTDWSDLSQHGNPGTWNNSTNKWDNIIGDNGGCIVRFKIEVVKPLYITGHTETNTSYWNAAIVTLNYSATGVAEDEELVAVASQTGATTLAAAPAFTTLADDETGAPEDQEDVIKAREASPDGTTLTFNLDKNQNQAQLLFEQPTWDKETGEKTDNFTPNTQYTYDVVLKKVDAEGNVTGEGNTYTTLQFTTAADVNDGTTAGVEDVTADDSNAPALYYNLQGIEVAQPAAGQIYIVRQGKTVKKVLVK